MHLRDKLNSKSFDRWTEIRRPGSLTSLEGRSELLAWAARLQVLLLIFSPGKPASEKGGILTPTLNRSHQKKSLRKDSATIRMVRFIPGRLVGPPGRREHRPYLISFLLIAGAFDSRETCRNETLGEEHGCRKPFVLIRRIVGDFESF